MRDKILLIIAALIFSAGNLFMVREVGGELYVQLFSGLIMVLLLLDNHRLRKKLKTVGHPDDFKSRTAKQ